ncbi:type IV secretion system protein [Legionella longbeachae]|uniref:type IV secretion system protein n=1 Tax=Legionella longbeachae TaxID=450 RepID=UPI0001BEBC96|nr:type IV secretion system protein [Legionella longbeachae]EEZ95952.1 Legionella vir-like protein LvhB5 [Legionella longbeachae D-4968]
MKKQFLFPLMFLFLINTKVYAGIIDGIDIALLIKAGEQLQQLRAQYKLLSQTYNNAKSQLDGIEDIKNFNSGHYGYGNLENSLSDLKNRQWSPNTWDDALQNISGGNPSRYQELVKAYQNGHVTLDDTKYLKGATQERLTSYKQNKAVNQAVSVQATYAFNEVNQHLKAIHNLSMSIDKAANTKSAVDLNSRILAELAYIQVENLRLQTLISQQVASQGSNEIALDSQSVLFNTLPDE